VSDDTSRLTYEQALAELDGVIAKLEGGEVALADAIACYERGARLAQHCADLLDGTEAQISQLVVSRNGTTAEKPLDVNGVEPRERPQAPLRARAAMPDALFGQATPARRAADPDINPEDIPF
jgi:exodeoxyribonuclease VII small subunit